MDWLFKVGFICMIFWVFPDAFGVLLVLAFLVVASALDRQEKIHEELVQQRIARTPKEHIPHDDGWFTGAEKEI